MVKFDVSLASQAPYTLPPEVWTAINELYTQLNSLMNNLNNRYGVIQSPSGHYWRISVSDTGVISTTDLGTYLA